MNSLPLQSVGISECRSPGREASEPRTEDKGKPGSGARCSGKQHFVTQGSSAFRLRRI